MARPRKKPLPIEAEVKEFLDSKRGDQKTSLDVREMVAAIMLSGLISNNPNVRDPQALKKQAFEWADIFLSK